MILPALAALLLDNQKAGWITGQIFAVDGGRSSVQVNSRGRSCQHILITGASAGIGEALARILAPDAGISALARRTDGRLSSLSSEHEHITGYQADVASFDSAKTGCIVLWLSLALSIC